MTTPNLVRNRAHSVDNLMVTHPLKVSIIIHDLGTIVMKALVVDGVSRRNIELQFESIIQSMRGSYQTRYTRSSRY